jgi:hypothetical protein
MARNVAALIYARTMLVGALEAQRVLNLGLVLVIGLLIVAVVGALLARAIVTKVITAAIVIVLMLIVWSQRSALQDCAARVKDEVTGGEAAQCTFLGLKVDVTP